MVSDLYEKVKIFIGVFLQKKDFYIIINVFQSGPKNYRLMKGRKTMAAPGAGYFLKSGKSLTFFGYGWDGMDGY